VLSTLNQDEAQPPKAQSPEARLSQEALKRTAARAAV